jgi:outer membrane protein TolC
LGQFLPQVNFNGSIGRSGPDNSLDGAFRDPNFSQNANLSLSASENIFSGFKDFASVDNSNALLDLAKAQLDQTKSQLSHDLKSAFYQLLFAQQQIDLLRQIVDRDKANQDLVQMNFDGGTDNKGSLLQAQAATAQDQFTVEQAQRALRVYQKQLDQVLGRDPMGEIVVQGDFDIPTLASADPEFAELTLQTPAHRQSLAQLHLSDSQYVSARGNFFPTLSANASLFRDGYNLSDLNNTGWSAGFSLSFPVFSGGRDFFNFKSAEESKKGAANNLKSSDLKNESSLENAYASYVDSVQEIQVQKFQLQAVQTQEEIAKAEYLNGLLIFQNWNQIETQLTNQQKTLLSAYLSIKTAEANWELAQGKGVIP